MGLRFNPAPGWPPPPPGFVPPPHWQPDPSWPPAPPGWQFWVDDDDPEPGQATGPQPRAGRPAPAPDGTFAADPAGAQARPGEFGGGPAEAPPWAGDFGTGPGEVPPWAGDFGTGPGEAPPWAVGEAPPWAAGDAPPRADDRTGPQSFSPPADAPSGAPTEVYGPGATGPQGRSVQTGPLDSPPFGPAGPFDPQDPFAGQVPGPGGPPSGPGAPGDGPGAAGRTSGLAVASLVLGLIGFTVIGAIASVICGIIALGRTGQIGGTGRTGQRGRGMAIAGLALSALWLVALGAFVVLHGSSSPTQPSPPGGHSASPTPTASPPASPGALSTNVFALRPGQCFQNPPASQTVLGVTYVTVVPCTTPHNAQAFVQFNAAGTSYPGVEALKRQADTGCHARIKKNVQTSKIKATMTLHYLYPLQASWNSGHRTITCMIVNARSNLTTSLLRSHPAGH